ncbi:protein kinase domain-containing protein [Cryobacterium arcticum]|uniref:non-specific serine/threonine protein kinase n=1 Tax=Cryobacterium arcticum TaxID=670052 RepID=A0A317ZZC7_9MICO|nr:protein kinase [Cryobacterium arcticum]PXA70641.1 serine/threonine protein kinase [Cryobacterium arcticum]
MPEPSRSDGLIGRTLVHRFRLDRLIGTGGMATVYEAADLALGRTVAVKLFRTDTADESGPQRQSGEIAVLASLNHFALVTLFDAGAEQIGDHTASFIVMEYIDGSDLRSRIGEGPLAAAEVARLGADLAEALHYVHARGIIHRDIKPANVLLAPSDFPGRVAHAKLADFGIARLFDATHLTRTGAVLGTAGYLSPEQALGEPIGPPSDVYSLGLVLLESLTGTRMYPGTAIESALARLQRQPEIPAALGPDWGSVLSAMTARDPADRLTAADAAARLRRLEPVAAGDAGDPVAAVDAGDPVAVSAADATRGDAPTRVFAPTATPDLQADDPTMVLPATAAGSSPVTAADRRSPARRRIVLGGVLVALLALAGVLFLVQPNEQPADPPAYPAVEGDLGVHLEQLQESVQP